MITLKECGVTKVILSGHLGRLVFFFKCSYVCTYLVYTPIVFPIDLYDKDFPIFYSSYFIARRAYAA